MGFVELIFLAAGLAMDAFAVSVCKGLAMPKLTLRNIAVVGLWFGFFQAMMPAAGYLLGSAFSKYIVTFDHWIAFALLFMIGINMLREAFTSDENDTDSSLSFKVMILLAIATSIDALAVGVTFAFLNVNIPVAVSFIGVITFILSSIGVKAGNVFGSRYKSKAEIAGGIMLILSGLKILLEHLDLLTL